MIKLWRLGYRDGFDAARPPKKDEYDAKDHASYY